MYDWANSAFATTMMAAVLPSFYSAVAGAHLDKTTASSYWGYTNTIAMLIIASSAPMLGAIADYKEKKKIFLGWFAAFGIIATALMVFVSIGDWFVASILYIIGRIGFAGSNIFYNSLLPHIVNNHRIKRPGGRNQIGIPPWRPKEKTCSKNKLLQSNSIKRRDAATKQSNSINNVSALGYAYGYLGGALLLTINLLMIMKPSLFGISNSEWGARFSFLTVAIWWALFSLPLLRHVPEPSSAHIIRPKGNPLLEGFHRLKNTYHDIKRYRQLIKFLFAFWLYNDGIGTIIIMAVIFGAEIGISQANLIGAILMVQFAGFPFSIFFGWLPEKIGTKQSILITLFVYSLISVLGYFMTEFIHFWILAFMVATVQGGAQALSRSMFATMTPKGKSAEFFGFYDVSGKFAGIIGPVIFGVVGQLTGSSRYGILALILFFVGGGLLLISVNHEEGIRSAQPADENI